MPSPVKKTGINMELNASKELGAIIGPAKGEKISRPQVVKRLSAYLKEANLQDPENKQFFTPDAKMEPVFGSERIKAFSMSKYLKEHLANPDK
uniref:SWIB domain-containing protein n=1 Tax=Paracalanus parvus TaxID=187406 RepID=A0A0U2TLV0_9MAXI|nr:SWIB domain-containing protein [Paracalanus parvus]